MNSPQVQLASLDRQFPSFITIVAQLNEAGIDWALSGSACLYVFGNTREPGDLELFVRDEDHDRIDSLFGITSVPYESPIERVRNSHPLGDHALQVTSHLVLRIEGHTYSLSLSPLQIAHRTPIDYEGQTLWMLALEDVLLAKALLQRDEKTYGKYDLADIEAFRRIRPLLDYTYLRARITELHAAERVGNILDEQ